ncbi:hypothetical protein V8C86DRAFT_2439038, partial [Haematococcus lacustris]
MVGLINGVASPGTCGALVCCPLQLDVEAGPGPGGAFLLWGLAAPLHALTAARMEGAGAGGGTTTGVAAAATATMAGVCAEVAEEGLWRRLLVRVQDCRPYWCVVGPACSDQGPAAGRQPRLLAREPEVEATGSGFQGWAHSQLQRLQQLLNTRVRKAAPAVHALCKEGWLEDHGFAFPQRQDYEAD